MMVKVKICGLYRREDIAAVNAAGSDYCGFIIHFPKSHRNVTPEQVKMLTRDLKEGIVRVGVLVNQPVYVAAELLNEGIVDIVQLHGDEDEDYIEKLRSLTVQLVEKERIWKAFKIKNETDIKRAINSPADKIVLDNGYGTGKVFDWTLLEDVDIKRPFLLAGGLTPENIPEAVRQIGPWGIDISSGVETDKMKDADKIMAAVRACHSYSEE
jgi:phosphoribosylanthranilate isomerase